MRFDIEEMDNFSPDEEWEQLNQFIETVLQCRYYISNLGRVCWIKSKKDYGFARTVFSEKRNNKMLVALRSAAGVTANYRLDALVYKAFVGISIPDKYEIIYKDRRPANCVARNLDIQLMEKHTTRAKFMRRQARKVERARARKAAKTTAAVTARLET